VLAVSETGPFVMVRASSFLSAAAFCASRVLEYRCRELVMRIVLAATAIAGLLVSFEAKAQERAADAAIGAVSGAVVLGPVGAVAGAIVGFTAGPAISRSWSMRASSSRPRVQRTSQAAAAPEPLATGGVPTPQPRPSAPAASPAPASPPPVSAPMASNKMPPVQGLE
jgi:hypothetical protein